MAFRCYTLSSEPKFGKYCLGWKEFTPSYVGPFRAETEVCKKINTVLPSMLHSVFSEPKFGKYKPTFQQNVAIENGVLIYAE